MTNAFWSNSQPFKTTHYIFYMIIKFVRVLKPGPLYFLDQLLIFEIFQCFKRAPFQYFYSSSVQQPIILQFLLIIASEDPDPICRSDQDL